MSKKRELYSVIVPGVRNVAYPPVCPCCCKEADASRTMEVKWKSLSGGSRLRKERTTANVQICAECKKHRSLYLAAYYGFIAIMEGLTGLLFLRTVVDKAGFLSSIGNDSVIAVMYLAAAAIAVAAIALILPVPKPKQGHTDHDIGIDRILESYTITGASGASTYRAYRANTEITVTNQDYARRLAEHNNAAFTTYAGKDRFNRAYRGTLLLTAPHPVALILLSIFPIGPLYLVFVIADKIF